MQVNVPQISVILALTGGSASVFVAYVMPVVMYFAVHPSTRKFRNSVLEKWANESAAFWIGSPTPSKRANGSAAF